LYRVGRALAPGRLEVLVVYPGVAARATGDPISRDSY
jgi:hypothetical protein